jgi:trimethyllysine dioxygenase
LLSIQAFHYIEEDVVLRATTPIFTHQDTHRTDIDSLVQFRFNNDDRTPVYQTPEHAAVHYQALQSLMSIIQSPDNEVWLHLEPHELLCTNNWRVMHGRSSFTGSRRLMGCYISVQDYSARIRHLFP